MANWQLILNISGLVLVYFAGRFSKSVLGFWNAGEWTSFAISGGILFFTMVVVIILFHIAVLKPSGSHTIITMFMTYFVYHVIIPIYGWRNHRKILKKMENPQKHQDALLMSILEENGQTEFGKDHNLNKYRSREDFMKKFPFTDFSFYEKYVDRVAKGEENVMTKAKVIHLSVTSGTTGKSKMYPLTDRDYQDQTEAAMAYMLSFVPETGLTLKRELVFRLSSPKRMSAGGITIGGMTAARKPVNFNSVMPPVLEKVMKEKPSFFTQALFGLREREIGMIQGHSSDLMYSFFKSMEYNKEKLAVAIETGHIEPFPELEEEVREELNKILTPDEDRAEEIRDLFVEGSVGLAKRLWPKITFCNTAKTGGFHHAAQMLEKSYLKGVKYGLGLHGGTEGFFGVAMNRKDFQDEICTLLPSTVFLEFIKEEEMDEKNPKTYLMEELQLGQTYELVVTNFNGLYRNRFGDVIKVVGYTNKCPKYIFHYRSGQILNCGFDRTTEKSFYNALKESEPKWGVQVQNYTTTESLNLENTNGEKYGRNHYVAFLEFQQGIILTKEQKDVLEANLCEQQESYAEFRGVKSIGPLNIIQVKPGTFDEIRALMFGDRPNMQFKTPRVTRSESLLSCLWRNRIIDNQK